MRSYAAGKVTVATPGTLVPFPAPSASVAPTGLVAFIQVLPSSTNAGSVFIGDAGLNRATGAHVIRELLKPSSASDVWESPQNVNLMDPTVFRLDANTAGDGAYLTYWVN